MPDSRAMPATPPLAFDLPAVIGHRGAAALAPENTLAGLNAGLHAGCRMLEVDAKLTADGALILLHDDTLDRTTDGRGPAATRTRADIRRLDAGGRFSPTFAGEPVPTLDAALDLCGQAGAALNIEIKPCPGRAIETAEAVVALLAARPAAGLPPILLSSFVPQALAVARDRAPETPRGLLLESMRGDWSALADTVAAVTVGIADRHATAERIAAIRATGRPALVYTVNDPARAVGLWHAGAAAVFTDVPDRLIPAWAAWHRGG